MFSETFNVIYSTNMSNHFSYMYHLKPGSEAIKLFFQLRKNCFLLINVQMPTVVGILTFISMKTAF